MEKGRANNVKPPREQWLMEQGTPSNDKRRGFAGLDSLVSEIPPEITGSPRTSADSAAPREQSEPAICRQCGTMNRVASHSPQLRPLCGRCKAPLPESVLVTAKREAVGLRPLWIGLSIAAGIIGLAVLTSRVPPPPEPAPSQPAPTRIEPRPPTPPAFTQPLQPLPTNGDETPYSLAEAVAPLTISTRQGVGHYFVKIVDWLTGAPVLTVFVHAGQSVSTKVPLGSYKIKYAVGTQWYGEADLFGPSTSYNMADKRFDFEKKGDSVFGFTVKLFSQPHGNLATTQIGRKDF